MRRADENTGGSTDSTMKRFAGNEDVQVKLEFCHENEEFILFALQCDREL